MRLEGVARYNVDHKSESTSSDIAKQSETAYCNDWGYLEIEAKKKKRGSFQRLESNRSIPLL